MFSVESTSSEILESIPTGIIGDHAADFRAGLAKTDKTHGGGFKNDVEWGDRGAGEEQNIFCKNVWNR